MPLFTNISGVNIYGGNFHDVAGNMNIQNNQQLQDCALWLQGVVGESHDALERPSTSQHGVELEDTHGGLSLSGVARNSRQTGTGRPVPYDVSFRHQPRSQRWRPPDRSSNGHVDNRPNCNARARLSHFCNVNAPGGDFGSNNGELNSYGSPRAGDFEYLEPGTNIHGGTFIGGNVNNGETGLHILYRSVSLEAMHDSADNDAQPKCHPETRTKMLEKLYNWCIGLEWSDASGRKSEDSDGESEDSEDSERESEDSERELYPEEDSPFIKVFHQENLFQN
ncbi:hypothetical protein C8J57DRAFT_759072 [Mycena rebaudengoi]|nr:hypothetical protein C8J57DRAFT_759072 [Mycena rebaudengoi]